MSGTVNYRREDFAIEEFCRLLSEVEEYELCIKCRPDDHGRTGQEKCDAIINRGGKEFTLEHTSLMSYRATAGSKNRKEHEILFDKVIRPLGIKETIQSLYPGFCVRICIPLGAFDLKFDYTSIFLLLKEELKTVVGQVRESYNGGEMAEFNFKGIPFPVWISRYRYRYSHCLIDSMVPIQKDQLLGELEAEVMRAINNKRKKLKQAKQQGASTILLLDSDDYVLVNENTLATAFGNAAPHADLEGIDEVFLLYGIITATWIAPLKIGNRLYPNLPEFQHYLFRLAEKQFSSDI